MKYFVLGALASGFLLYGLSMMYGATGTLTIPDAFTVIGSGSINKEVLSFGVVFVVAGLAFKLGVVPFHMSPRRLLRQYRRRCGRNARRCRLRASTVVSEGDTWFI